MSCRTATRSSSSRRCTAASLRDRRPNGPKPSCTDFARHSHLPLTQAPHMLLSVCKYATSFIMVTVYIGRSEARCGVRTGLAASVHCEEYILAAFPPSRAGRSPSLFRDLRAQSTGVLRRVRFAEVSIPGGRIPSCWALLLSFRRPRTPCQSRRKRSRARFGLLGLT